MYHGQLKEILENHMKDKLLKADNEFHKMLFELTNKMDIYSLLKNFDIHFDRVRSVVISAVKELKIVEDHKKILEAIESGNEELAVQTMNKHLNRDKIDKEELREKYPQYFKES